MTLGTSSPKNNTSHRGRVVIIEDDQAIRETLGMYLEGEGYEVAYAADGKEGLELLKNISKPGLILLDLLMPVMDGWQFLEQLARDSTLASIPVAIVTAYADRAHGIKGRVILKKPVDLEALSTLVKKYCDPSEAAKSGAA
jgi:CheY-like chemotaxis protein